MPSFSEPLLAPEIPPLPKVTRPMRTLLKLTTFSPITSHMLRIWRFLPSGGHEALLPALLSTTGQANGWTTARVLISRNSLP
jgi:hypothetical protein